MFKRSMRVTASILSVAVAASLLVFPQLSHAQAASNVKLASVSVQDVSTAPVEYKGSIISGGANIYMFTVAVDSTVTVTDAIGDSKTRYWLSNVASGKSYTTGDVLPAGTYQFVVYGSAVDYDFTLSGVSFAGVPDNTLPTYNITSPTQHSIFLPWGTKTVTFTGTTDATQAELGNINDSSLQKAVITNSTFSVDVPVRVGGFTRVEYRFFKADGNGVDYYYDLTVKSIERIAGTDRFQGSALVSHQMGPSDTVIIVNGFSFADGLSGAALAVSNNIQAPILLTKASGLSVDVMNEIKRKPATKAIILGGTGAVSTNVEKQLKTLGITQISRIAGADRYATSAAVAAQLQHSVDGELVPIDTAIIVSGENFPDALSASSPSAELCMPILLVKSNEIPAPIQQYITSHNIKKFIIVGGSGVVSTAVEDQLVGIAGSANNVTRLYGQNRYQTSVEVAKYFFGSNPWGAVIASGTNFPDALAAGPFAGSWRAPILLTSPTALPTEVSDYLSNDTNKNLIYILGGTGAVSTNVEQQLETMMQ